MFGLTFSYGYYKDKVFLLTIFVLKGVNYQ